MKCPFFSYFMKWYWRPLSLQSWHFKSSEDIMTKFKSQALHIIRIKCCNDGGSGNPPSLIYALWRIGILLHKQATHAKHFERECSTWRLHEVPKLYFCSILLSQTFFQLTCIYFSCCFIVWNFYDLITLLIYLYLLF